MDGLPTYEDASSHWRRVSEVPPKAVTDKPGDIVVYADFTGTPHCTWLFTDASSGTIFLCHRVPSRYFSDLDTRMVFVYFPELQTHMPLQEGCDNFALCVTHLAQTTPELVCVVDEKGYLHLPM